MWKWQKLARWNNQRKYKGRAFNGAEKDFVCNSLKGGKSFRRVYKLQRNNRWQGNVFRQFFNVTFSMKALNIHLLVNFWDFLLLMKLVLRRRMKIDEEDFFWYFFFIIICTLMIFLSEYWRIYQLKIVRWRIFKKLLKYEKSQIFEMSESFKVFWLIFAKM